MGMKRTLSALALATFMIGCFSGCSEVLPQRIEGKYAYSILGAKTTSLRFTRDGTVHVETFMGTDQKGTYTMDDGKVEVTVANNGTAITQTYTKNNDDSFTDSTGHKYEREKTEN